ncbi:MAG TPA: hypothetical protein VFP93_01640 [Gammaproteobacteria bacterium]|nr:hypothetical protein [Gammaproteobacteria bacterium]
MQFSKKQIDHAIQCISSRLFEENTYTSEQRTWFVENFKALLKQITATPYTDLTIRIASNENKLRGFFSHCEKQGIAFNLKESYVLAPGRTMEYSLREDGSIGITTLFQKQLPSKNNKHKSKQALQSFLQEEKKLYLEEIYETKEPDYLSSNDTDYSESDTSSIPSMDAYLSDDELSSHGENSAEENYWTQEEYKAIFLAISKALKNAQLAKVETETHDNLPSLCFDFKKKVEQKRETNQKHKNPIFLLKQWEVKPQKEEQVLEEIPKHLQRKRAFNHPRR